jgi:hypothetical protein
MWRVKQTALLDALLNNQELEGEDGWFSPSGNSMELNLKKCFGSCSYICRHMFIHSTETT